MTATTGECGAANLYDSRYVIYVMLPRECEFAQTPVVSLTISAGSAVQTVQLEFERLDDAQTVAVPQLGDREIQLSQSGRWRELPNEGTWVPRDGAGLLLLNGQLYLLGGWLHGPLSNEVWVTRNLIDWTFLGFAPWQPRHGAAWLVHDGRLLVIGGELIDDIWSSADGVNWRQEIAHAPFGKRYTPNAASLGNKFIVYGGIYWEPVESCDAGGQCTAVGPRDVWQSTDGGRTWEMINVQGPWQGRGLIHGSAVFNGRIFLIGGGLKAVPPGARFSETVREFTDICTSADGITWEQSA